MDDVDFKQFMSYLSSENDFGSDRKIRFISEDMANDIKSLMSKDE